MRQDLSSALFRDLRIQMNPELELVMDRELLDEIDGGPDTLLPAGKYSLQITGASLLRRRGSDSEMRASTLLVVPDYTR